MICSTSNGLSSSRWAEGLSRTIWPLGVRARTLDTSSRWAKWEVRLVTTILVSSDTESSSTRSWRSAAENVTLLANSS